MAYIMDTNEEERAKGKTVRARRTVTSLGNPLSFGPCAITVTGRAEGEHGRGNGAALSSLSNCRLGPSFVVLCHALGVPKVAKLSTTLLTCT